VPDADVELEELDELLELEELDELDELLEFEELDELDELVELEELDEPAVAGSLPFPQAANSAAPVANTAA